MFHVFEVSTDKTRLDITFIHDYLSQESYWAQGRSREAVERTIENSLCFGVFDGARQIGFGRVVTDHAVFGYVADVFVTPAYRGRGVGKALTRAITEHPVVAGLKMVLLRTRDAHALYAQSGFAALRNADEMMGLYRG